MAVTLSSNPIINTSASSSSNNRRIANVGVLLYSFNDIYMSKIKQRLEDIENANTVKFTFFDCKCKAFRKHKL